MGSTVSTYFGAQVARDDVFAQPAIKEEFQKFLEQEHGALSFGQFIKNGHWLGMLSHYDHCDHSKPGTPKNSTKRTEIRWVYLHFMVVDQLKEQVDEFLRQSTTVESSSPERSARNSWNRAMQADFHESYKYNPDTATFSLNDMTAIMCTILFPLYLGSEEYQHWKAWHVAKKRKINGPYLASASGDHTGDLSGHNDEGTGTADVEHLKHILLSTAAFLDQAELQAHFARPTLFEDAQQAIFNTTFGICICSATQPFQTRTSQVLPDGTALYVNRAFERMTGFSLKHLASKGLNALHGADTEKQQIERIHTAMRDQSGIKTILTQYRRSGSKFLAALALKPSYDNTGDIVYWIALYFDMSVKTASLAELKRIDDLLALIPNLLCYPPNRG